MNRHNPPSDLTPQQRRWLEQAKARRGIIYTPWRVEREPTQSTQAPVVKYIPCKALIRSKSGAKYCGSCNYDLRQQRMAKRAKQARERIWFSPHCLNGEQGDLLAALDGAA